MRLFGLIALLAATTCLGTGCDSSIGRVPDSEATTRSTTRSTDRGTRSTSTRSTDRGTRPTGRTAPTPRDR